METHVLGFPRIGVNRELKKAQEAYWRGALSREELAAVCDELKQRHWRIQLQAGLSFVATGDFSLYDHILDTTAMLGAVPERFGWDTASPVDVDLYFRMARGDAARNIPPMEMTKWFDANYHYLVPEWTPNLPLKLSSLSVLDDTRRARALGFRPKPVLTGPITYLCLAKEYDHARRWDRLDEVAAIYAGMISRLAADCDWIQLDEPILCTDLDDETRRAFASAYTTLAQSTREARLLLTTYFGVLDDNLDLALQSGCAGLHIDLVRGKDQFRPVLDALPETMTLSAGIVNGRNIWKTDLAQALDLLRAAADRLGAERLMVASSCSLLHSPVDLDGETALDPELRDWMAFATQKCQEIGILGAALRGEDRAADMAANAASIQRRRTSARVHSQTVCSRCAEITPEMYRRANPYPIRKQAQAWLALPPFPTTTIGSFPQTPEIRNARLQYRRGELSEQGYADFLKGTIQDVIRQQEELGLDVLVHGESERNDMVEYFGQQLDGFCFSQNGWVQSYGSRCVKPPIIFGDVSRPRPMTVDWIKYAQSLTTKPMKGMLTGPVTILCWSFVRDDLERSEVCKQLALTIHDEVADLERAGIRIIQIDEAALREGLPIRKRDAAGYLRWAVDAFRLATACVGDGTQIHTHMCYSEFNTIIQWIAEMDADVISIESSRSKMDLLEAFKTFQYPNEIGPGVYDIHSPRVPTVDEMLALLKRALDYVPPERLWVNPDCGLKTRAWPETLASLRNMVAAARQLRQPLARVLVGQQASLM